MSSPDGRRSAGPAPAHAVGEKGGDCKHRRYAQARPHRHISAAGFALARAHLLRRAARRLSGGQGGVSAERSLLERRRAPAVSLRSVQRCAQPRPQRLMVAAAAVTVDGQASGEGDDWERLVGPTASTPSGAVLAMARWQATAPTLATTAAVTAAAAAAAATAAAIAMAMDPCL
jgi:hypothetical protein